MTWQMYMCRHTWYTWIPGLDFGHARSRTHSDSDECCIHHRQCLQLQLMSWKKNKKTHMLSLLNKLACSEEANHFHSSTSPWEEPGSAECFYMYPYPGLAATEWDFQGMITVSKNISVTESWYYTNWIITISYKDSYIFLCVFSLTNTLL